MASRPAPKAKGKRYMTVAGPLTPQATLQTNSVAGDRCGTPAPGGFNTSTITCFSSVTFEGQEFLAFLAPSHTIGRLAGMPLGTEVFDSSKNVLGFHYEDGPTGMDVAVATVKTGAPVDGEKHLAFTYSGVCRAAVVGDSVKIFGGSPKQVRRGKVVATAFDVPVNFPSGARILRNLFRVESNDGSQLCAAGDAGTLIVSEADELLGLLVGSDEKGAVLAHQLKEVQSALGLGDFHPATAVS